MSNELIEAQTERRLSRVIQKYARYGLVVVDELGYVPFSKESAELLFQVLAERHERGSVIITTNLGFADWTQVFGDATLTATLLDRLTHKAHIINCTWESYRLKETLRARRESSKGPEDNASVVMTGGLPCSEWSVSHGAGRKEYERCNHQENSMSAYGELIEVNEDCLSDYNPMCTKQEIEEIVVFVRLELYNSGATMRS